MSSSSFLGSTPYAQMKQPWNMTKRGGLAGFLGEQYNVNRGLESGAQQQRGSEYGALMPGYQGLISSGGYSPTEKASIEQGALGGVNNAYGAASDQASRRMARTGNSAGYGSFLGSMARGKARDLGSTELQVQSQFADEALRRKMAGLAGISQLYGVDTSFLNSVNSQQNGLLGVGADLASTRKGGPVHASIGVPGVASIGF